MENNLKCNFSSSKEKSKLNQKKNRLMIIAKDSPLCIPVLKSFLEDKENPKLFLSTDKYDQELESLKVEFFKASLSNEKFLKGSLEDVNRIINIAKGSLENSKSKKDFFDINFNLNKLLIDTAIENNMKKFVFVSDAITSLKSKRLKTAISGSSRDGFYLESLMKAEEYIKQAKIDSFILAPTFVYDLESSYSSFGLIEKIKRSSLVMTMNKEAESFEPVDIRKLISSIKFVLENENLPFKKYLVKADKPIPFKEFLDQIEQKFNLDLKIVRLSENFAKGLIKATEILSLIKRSIPSLSIWELKSISENLLFEDEPLL